MYLILIHDPNLKVWDLIHMSYKSISSLGSVSRTNHLCVCNQCMVMETRCHFTNYVSVTMTLHLYVQL